MFSGHNGIKVVSMKAIPTGKNKQLEIKLPNNLQIKEELSREIKSIELNKIESTQTFIAVLFKIAPN